MKNTNASTKRRALRWITMLAVVAVLLCALVIGTMAAGETAKLTQVSVTLSEDIALNYWATIPEEDVDKATVVFQYKGFTYPPISAADATERETDQGTFYLFHFNGIAPQNITETLTGTLYIDGVQAGEPLSYSVAEYCEYYLEDESLSNLMTAILNYSAAAKWYVGETDTAPNLVDLPAKENMSVVAKKGLGDKPVNERATMKSVGLILSNVVSTYFDFQTFLENPSLKVTVDGEERDARIINNDDGTYRAIVDIKATELFGKIEATVTDSNGNDISRTATYSVTAYLHTYAENPDEKLATLVRTIYAYGLYAHDLDSHELKPVGFSSGTTMTYACEICKEYFGYTLSENAYLEDYSDGTGGTHAPDNSKLYNVDGTLRVVIDKESNNNAGIYFNTKDYITSGANSFLVGFDIKSAAGREGDFGVLMKPNNAWTYQPKSWFVTVTPAGVLKIFDKEVGTVSTDAFTSILINVTVEQDTTKADDVAKFIVDAWINGQYIDSFESNAQATTGTTKINMDDSQVQISTRNASIRDEDGNITEHKSNEIYLDNVIFADGISDAAGKNIDDLVTLVHDFVETKNEAATCYRKGEIVHTCAACAKTETENSPTTPHDEFTLKVENGKLVVACAICSANVNGGAEWTSETLKIADGVTNNAMNMPAATNGEYHISADSSTRWEPQFYVDKQPEVAARRGVFSIRMKGNVTTDFDFQLYNRGEAWGDSDDIVNKGTAHGVRFLKINKNGDIMTHSYKESAGTPVKIGSIDTTGTNYTTITVVFEKDTVNDTFELDYYVDGVYKTSVSISNYLYNNTPYGIYISGWTTNMYIDDFIFAYSDAARDEFIQHTHSMQEQILKEATCQQEGLKNATCTTCGYAESAVAIPKLTHVLKTVSINKGTKQMIYECVKCEERFALSAGWVQDFSNGATEKLGDGTTANVDDAQKLIATPASGTGVTANQASIAAYPNGKTTTSTILFGFDIKNTDKRAGDFWVQWKISGSWTGDSTKIFIDPNGNIKFNGKDTGVDISGDGFTSFVEKATLTIDGTNATLTMELWINGQYIDQVSVTVANLSNAKFQDGTTYAQLCIANFKGENEILVDNMFLADAPSGMTNDYITDGMEVLHNMVAIDIDANNNLIYECKGCEERYTVPLGYGDTMSGDTIGFGTSDLDTDRSGIQDGAYILSASQTSGNSNALISAAPNGKIKGTNTMLLGFDIKNTDFRGTNNDAYFMVQWKIPCAAGNWSFNGTETDLLIKPDGSIYFANKNTDTGLDISKDEFTSILMKVAFTESGSSTTLSIDLWVNGMYVATATKNVATTEATLQDGNAAAQICVQNYKTVTVDGVNSKVYLGRNEVIIDNLFVADVPAAVVADKNLDDILTVAHNFGEATVVDPTCTATGSSTATCKACGETIITTLPKLPHTLSYTGTLATYKCSDCKTKYVLTPGFSMDYNDGGLGAIPFDNAYDTEAENKVVNVEGTLLVTHNNNTGSNNALNFDPERSKGTTGTKEIIFGFDLMGNGTRYGDIVLQAKVSGQWNSTPTRVFVTTAGVIKLGNTDTGYRLTDEAFTNFVVKYSLTENASDTTLTIDLWINGNHAGQARETIAATGLSWQATWSSYAQLCLPKTGDADKTHSMYVDNVFIADVPAEADGTDLANYMSEAPHALKTETVDPTCTKEGYDKLVCTDEDCGYEEITRVIPKLGHNWPSSLAYDNDEHYYECTRCSVRTGSAGHAWGEGEVTLEPTCESVGTRLFTCADCSATKQVDEPKSAHAIDVSGGTYNAAAATTSSVFGHGTTTYRCESCEEDVTFDTPINYDYAGGQGIGTNANYTFTAVTENGNTYGQYVSNNNAGKDMLSFYAANTDAAYKDGSFFKMPERMIFSIKLKTADGYGIKDGTIFMRTQLPDGSGGYFTLVKWDDEGYLTLPGFEDDAGNNDESATESDDGLELPTIDIIPSRPKIHMNWTELTFDADLTTGYVDVYVDGEYVCTTESGYGGTYPVMNGQYVTVKLNSSTAEDTALCVDDVKLVFAD